MAKLTGIIDEPVSSGGQDHLDISVHTKSLIRFIRETNTPITIGIQGEWGSGKTSLLNSIYHDFSSNQECKQIWINSWEYSLLSSPEESLLKIINKIIDDLLDSDVDVDRKTKIKSGAEKLFKGALRIGATAVGGSEAGNVAKELLGSSDQSISQLRGQLNNLVDDIAARETNPFKKVLIYVDDLDRIEPKNAVAILELLKNIFSIPHCVFILAIDYQVVVKGLEYKFGKQTPENEWEFRAFFDKIIQLPFMMPMGQYNIGKYVNHLLTEVGFVGEEGLDAQDISEVILRTIGGNPRSIKRLVNSVSLIQIFTEEKSADNSQDSKTENDDGTNIDNETEKFLIFALLCLQIAYPPIYSLLTRKPDFTTWDNNFALGETKKKEEEKKEIFDREFNLINKSEEFDDEWEQALFRVCYLRPRLKPRVEDISKFFSYLKSKMEDGKADIGDSIESVLNQTSVTSVASTDQGQDQPKSGRSKGYDNKDFWLFFFNLAQEKKTDLFQKTPKEGSLKYGYCQETVKQIEKPALKYYVVVRCKKDCIVVQFCMSKKNKEQDRSSVLKAMDFLMSKKAEIESSFGNQLEWNRDENRDAQRVGFTFMYDMEQRDKWGEYCESAIPTVTKIVDAVKGPASEVNQQL